MKARTRREKGRLIIKEGLMREYVVFGHKLHEMLKNGVCAVNWCFIHHAVGGGSRLADGGPRPRPNAPNRPWMRFYFCLIPPAVLERAGRT